MQGLEDKTLGLFFTRGVSLKMWHEQGILEREIKPYLEYARSLKEVYFFTYGDGDDQEYQGFLPENIKIFPKRYNISSTFVPIQGSPQAIASNSAFGLPS